MVVSFEKNRSYVTRAKDALCASLVHMAQNKES